MEWLCVYFIYSIIWFWQQNKKSSTYSAVPSMSTSAYRHTLWPLAFSVIVGLFQNLGFEAHFKSKTLLKTESASEKNKELCRIRSMCVWWHKCCFDFVSPNFLLPPQKSRMTWNIVLFGKVYCRTDVSCFMVRCTALFNDALISTLGYNWLSN